MSNAMSLVESLKVLQAARTDQVVVTTMSSAREWMLLGAHPLDFIYAPSSMGQAPGIGLGIALARPERQVIVCNGDGGMLMNLGALVTTTATAATNYLLIVFDNGVYEVTGAQPTAASPHGRPATPPVDYCALARASGFAVVFDFYDLADWQVGVEDVLASSGPVFVRLAVEPMPGAIVPKSPAPPGNRWRELAAVLDRSTQSGKPVSG